MPDSVNSPRPLPTWQRMGLVLASAASLSGLGYMVYVAIKKVGSGHGIDAFRTVRLEQSTWLDFLVFCVALAGALVVGIALRFREHLRWRDLERRYDQNRDA